MKSGSLMRMKPIADPSSSLNVDRCSAMATGVPSVVSARPTMAASFSSGMRPSSRVNTMLSTTGGSGMPPAVGLATWVWVSTGISAQVPSQT